MPKTLQDGEFWQSIWFSLRFGLLASLIQVVVGLVLAIHLAPFALLILHTAHSAIPTDIREAAALDGAKGLRSIMAIDIPLLIPAVESLPIEIEEAARVDGLVRRRK